MQRLKRALAILFIVLAVGGAFAFIFRQVLFLTLLGVIGHGALRIITSRKH